MTGEAGAKDRIGSDRVLASPRLKSFRDELRLMLDEAL